jgi:hypothetical protein
MVVEEAGGGGFRGMTGGIGGLVEEELRAGQSGEVWQ